jgi:hypothetical protein
MALPRFIVFFLAPLALAGCCASGSGCYVAVPGIPTAWDGAGTRPRDVAQPRNRLATRMARPKKKILVESVAEVQVTAVPLSDDEQIEATNRTDDARLKKLLMICRGCSPEREDDATGSAGADRAASTSASVSPDVANKSN